MDESYNKLRHLLSGKALFLAYEDDVLNDPRVAYIKICNYLNIKNENPEIKLHRSNPFSYEEMVANFEDVKALLGNTKYSWMLDD